MMSEIDALNDLTPKLRAVCAGLLRGLSEKQIAADLELTQDMVHSQIKQIHRRLQVHSRAELLAACQAKQIGSLSDSKVQRALAKGVRPLSYGQREILCLLLSHRSELQISRDLDLNFHTLHRQVKVIYRRYRVQSRAELVRVTLTSCRSA